MNTADAAIAFAMAQIGKPYVWGATGPNSYDCSGLVYASFKHAGYKFAWPRPTTGTLILAGSAVSKSQLQPGDLVFPDPGHVQIYVGNGYIVEAPRPGLKVRKVKMWGFWRARRLVQPGTGATANTVANVENTTSFSINPLAAFDPIFTTLTDGHFWYRIGLFLSGLIILVLVAIRMG